MSDLFISYSRKDIAYAKLLHKALKEHDFDTWIDWQDIPPSTEWLKEVYSAIEQASTFIFILSSTSTLSEICVLEIDHARKNNKRIIPIVINDVEPSKVHPALAAINWIFSRSKDELQPALANLIEAIQTDYDWVKVHTRLQMRALEWDRASQDSSFLLQGTDLQQAENWLAEAPEKEPDPTLTQTRYIQSSRQEAVKRQRRLLLSVGAALIVTIVLGVFAVINGQRATQNAFSLATQVVVAEEQKGIAEEQARLAHIRELTAISQQTGIRFDLAMLLGVESFNTIDNYQTRNNLFKLSQLNPEVSRIMSSESVTSVSFSPDGKILVSAGGGDSIILWDVSSGQPLGDSLQVHSDKVTNVIFSPNGEILASGHGGGSIILWDMATGQSYEKHGQHPGGIVSIAFSPDGKILASAGGDGTIILWDTASMQPIGKPLRGFIAWTGNITFSPDGKTLASEIDPQAIKLWDVASGQPIGEPLRGHKQTVINVAFSPDGKILASGSEDNTIILWDMESKQPIGEPLVGHSSAVSSITFSPDGNILAAGSWDRTITLWDVANGQTIGEPLSVHTERITSIAFSPDGKTLASCSEDGTIILWNLDGREYTDEILPMQIGYLISSSLSPDGKNLASVGEDGSITIFDVTSGQPIGEPLKWHADQVWNPELSEIQRFIFSPDGKTLASVREDGTIFLWDTASGELIGDPLQGHSYDPVHLSFSPDSKILASGGHGEDGAVILWDAASGQPIGDPLQRNIGYISSVVFSPDGKILAVGHGGGTILWDVTSRQPLGDTLRGHTDWVISVAFSPDGKTLASGGWDGIIILWDIDSHQPISDPMRGYADGITSVIFSPDGETLASGYADGTILMWDVASGQPLGNSLRGHTERVTNIAFSQDGKTLTSGSEDGTIFVWDADVDSLLNRVCEKVGRNFTQDEWAFYFPGEPNRKTCEQWPESK